MEIGERIKEMAVSKNISAQQLARELGKTRQAVYDIYTGRVKLTVDMLFKIAKVLKEPAIKLLILSPDDYYDLIPESIPIEEVLKLISLIHESAKEGKGMVNLHLIRSTEGMYIFDHDYTSLEEKLSEERINRYANHVYESYRITNKLA